MSGPLSQVQADIETAVARRQRVQASVDQRWHDAARRAAEQRVLAPLDLEVARLRSAIDELNRDLQQALSRMQG